ncbi:hypothetical protein AMTR_s00069p00197120 [Amborella trichopoda]|uniref:VLRF1 domain-containing protein n=1 Tax=Amborella trichopoda TaxID=13333 RepID=U5DDI4_AMBTC|nr:hypothetical protein AMTR_s00069p00197120 [Amborella trichopoda]
MAGKLDSKPSSSVFHLPSNFFHAFRLVLDLEDDDQSRPSPSDSSHGLPGHVPEASVSGLGLWLGLGLGLESNGKQGMRRWSCNTCKSEFESLEEQRSHFKSDIHRFNVKLSLAGKSTVKEEDFDELVGDSMSRDYEVSSISGSEDEGDKEPSPNAGTFDGLGKGERTKQRIFTILNSGKTISIWKCLLLGDHEDLSYEKNKSISPENVWCAKSLGEDELINKLQHLVCEPRNKTHLRIVLLASGGHFAGCVFDGDSIVAHKTFHRYVVRAKSGKKQSSKDGTGKASKSAGASLRRYNELALKKEVQELLASWKPYFDASVCIFVHAPSNNRQLLYDGENSIFVIFEHLIRRVPVTVRRPTLKEARRVYSQLTHIIYVTEDQRAENDTKEKESTEEKTVSCEKYLGIRKILVIVKRQLISNIWRGPLRSKIKSWTPRFQTM